MTYILGDTKRYIDTLQIKSIAIDSNYKQMNMPMVFVTATVSEADAAIMEENQNSGIFIFNLKRAVSNSDMPDLYVDYIDDKFIYFIAEDITNNEKPDGHFKDDDPDDGEDYDFTTISLGLLSLDHVNKNKKALNGVVSSNLSSLMYYATGHLPILIEPPTNNVEIKNLFIPPMNSISKTLNYINSISVFYNTPFRFFIDFDCAYLLSSSGKPVKRKGEDINTVLITLRNSDDAGSRINGMTINKSESIYQIDVNADDEEGDCKISDNHISGKSYSNIVATGTSGNAFNKSVIDVKDSELKKKIKTIRVRNDNYGLLDNMISSLNTSSIQLLIQKTDIDASIITLNKEYIVQAGEVYEEQRYSGRYLLTRKRELFIRLDKDFTTDTMLLFEKVSQ